MRKFTLAFVSMLFSLGAIAETVTVYGIGAQLASSDLNEKTESTMIAIKNLSATNHYYYVGNTGAAPYSKADFNEAAVFVWEPVTEGTPGSYYLRKLDGTYMQKSAPKDFGTKDNAAVFTTTNPTSTGSGSTKFNGDGDSQDYINNDNDNPNLVRFVNEAGTWINVQNGDSGTPTYNSGLGGWTIHYVYAVDEKAGEQLTYNLTDKAGNIFVGSYEGLAGTTKPTLTGTPYSLSNEAWEGATFTAEIEFPLPVSSAEVTNETMIANFNATQRWHAVDLDVKVQTEEPTVATMDEWMWAIYPVFNNGAFTFKVKNIATGKFVTVNKEVSSFDTQGTVTLTEEETATELEVITWLNSPCFIVSGSNYVYLTINGTADTDVYLASWTGGNNNHAGNKLHFPNPTYNVTISDAKAATLTTPFAVSLPDGVTAGYVSGVDTEKQTLVYTDVTTIPAGESVVLFGEAGTYTFNKVAEADAFGTNYLVGYSEATDIPAGQTVYALGNKSNGVAFYTFTGAAYAAGKAYLQLPAAEAQAIGYFNVFGGEGTTGIEAAVSGEQTVVIYDLSGRRVEKMEKGIYIVNGKKVIR